MRNELLALAFLALSACCSESSECADNDDVGTDGTIDAQVVLSPDISTVAFVTWTPQIAGDSWVEFGLDGAFDQQTPKVPTTAGQAHEQVVLGLKAERTYTWRAVTEGGGGRWVSADGTLTTGAPAVGTSDVTVFTDLRDQQDPAPYLLTVTGKPSAVVIYDRDGDVVWSYAVPGTDLREVVTVRAAWDHKSVLYALYDQVQDAATGGIYRVSLDGRTVVFTSTISAHHDFVERKDGTFAYLSQDYRPQYPVTGTCDKTNAELTDCSVADVVADVILETPEGVAPGTPATAVYNHFDDSGDAPFWTCDHMEDPFPPEPEATYHQWTHGNSLVPDPIDPENAYWINLRYQDALIKVSRNHELLGVIGGFGPRSNIVPVEDAFDHGHYSQMWPGGFLIFDNNTHRDDLDDDVSHVREYSYDPATNTNVTLVHEWKGEQKTAGMADARKTSVGTVLINWSIEKKVQEVTTDDVVVWGASFAGSAPGRMVLLNDLYELDPPYDYW